MNRGSLLRVLKPFAGLALLTLLVSRLDTTELSGLWARGDRLQLALGAALFVLAFGVLQAARLHLVVRHYTQGWSNSLRLFAIGAFFNNLLPSNVGGDAVRLLYLRNMRPGNWAAPLALLLLHRLSGILVLLAAAAVHGLFFHERMARLISERGLDIGLHMPAEWLLAAPILLGLAVLVGLGLPAGKRVRGKLLAVFGRCSAAIGELSALDLWSLLGLTILFHLARLSAFYVTLGYLGSAIDPLDLIPVLAVTAIVALLPITVGGLGLLEGSITVMLALFGVPASVGIAAALVNRVVLVLIAGLGGVLYAMDRDALKSTPLQAGEAPGSEAQASPDAPPEA